MSENYTLEILRLLFRQYLSRWRQFSTLLKIQTSILAILIFVVLASRSYSLLSNELSTVQRETAALVLAFFNFSRVLTFPFLIRFAFPVQPVWRLLQKINFQPKSDQAVFWFLFLIYDLGYILFFLSVLTGWVFVSISNSFLLLLAFILYQQFFFFIIYVLGISTKGSGRFYAGLLVLSLLLLFSTALDFLFFPLIGIIFLLISVIIYQRRNLPALLNLAAWPLLSKNHYSLQRELNPATFAKGRSLRPLAAYFRKEWYSAWRNSAFSRLRGIYLFLSLALSILLRLSAKEDPAMWMMIGGMILFWLYYSHFFNPKYQAADPAYLRQTQPLRFSTVWLAKLGNELIPGLILWLVYILPMVLTLPFSEIWQPGSALFIYILLIIILMLNFRMMFYDNPRLAGLAYHSSILFLLIIILNDFLVGPIIAFGLNLYFFIRNVQYFRRAL